MLTSFTWYQQGLLGKGIQYAESAIGLAEEGGLIAINSMRAELSWIYAYCGAFDKAIGLVDRALQVAVDKQPAWIAFLRRSRSASNFCKRSHGTDYPRSEFARTDPVPLCTFPHPPSACKHRACVCSGG
jgi:hypothetical protein